MESVNGEHASKGWLSAKFPMMELLPEYQPKLATVCERVSIVGVRITREQESCTMKRRKRENNMNRTQQNRK